MPVFLLTDDALHVQPLHPELDRVVELFRGLGFGFHADGAAATTEVPTRKAGVFLGLASATPEDILGLTKYRFPLEDLKRVAVGERFPDLTIEIRGPSGLRRETYDLTPELPRWVPGPATDEMRAYGRAVGALLDTAREQGWPGERSTGWLDLPPVEWEPADFPSQEKKELPTYRSAPQTQQRIVAERGPGGTFERLTRGLLLRARSSPRRVVLTAEDIFADFAGLGVHRLPRGLPRWSDGRELVLGRYAGICLEPRSKPCPVAALLSGDG